VTVDPSVASSTTLSPIAPTVSVVIPTRNRPRLVRRAVESALLQTYSPLEVLVVLDGVDPETENMLAEIVSDTRDVRLRLIRNQENQGGAQARNIGVHHAHGDWIAFLDDDDEWLPQKLEKQMNQLLTSSHKQPVGTCRLIARREGGDLVWPYRRPQEQEPLSEYLLCRRSFAYGEGVIQTSTIVAQKTLLLQQPFLSSLTRHHDWDWVLRVAKYEGATFEWAWEPLVIFHLERGRQSIHGRTSWLESLRWAHNNPLLTPRAFSHFAAIQIAPRLHLFRDYRLLPHLLQSLFQNGSLEPRAIAYGLLFFFTPTSILKNISQRNLLSRQMSPQKTS